MTSVTPPGYTGPRTHIRDLDREDGLAPGTRWLGRFHANHFSWLQWLFGRAMMLRMTDRGHECFATRITEKNPIWTSYTYHDYDVVHDGHG